MMRKDIFSVNSEDPSYLRTISIYIIKDYRNLLVHESRGGNEGSLPDVPPYTDTCYTDRAKAVLWWIK